MAKQLACGFLVVLMISMTLGSSDVPFMVAHKKASLNRLKSGSDRVSVSIDIYNQGSVSAYDVSLIDDAWPSEAFEVTSGNLTKSWERIDAGGVVSHKYELEAKSKGVFNAPPASITFRIPTKSALQQAFSTPVLPLDLLADRPSQNNLYLLKSILAKYGSLVSVITIVVLFVYLVATPSKSNAGKGSKKKR